MQAKARSARSSGGLGDLASVRRRLTLSELLVAFQPAGARDAALDGRKNRDSDPGDVTRKSTPTRKDTRNTLRLIWVYGYALYASYASAEATYASSPI